MIRQIRRVLAIAAITVSLVASTASVARTQPPSAPVSPGSGKQAQELPARHLPPIWTTSFWTAARIKAAVPRGVGREAATNSYRVGAGVTFGVRSNNRLLVTQGSNTLSALWPDNDAVRRATGKIFFSLAGQYYTCSGTVVTDSSTQRSVVLTAAHCVYGQGMGFAQNWVFIPDYVDSAVSFDLTGSFCAQTALGCWTAQSMVVSRNFAYRSSFDDTASLHDYAFVSVNLGGRSGSSQLDQVVSPLPIRSSGSVGVSTWAVGYPVGYPYDGTKLIYSNTPLGRDAYNNFRTYQIGSVMTEGSSGGPWVQGLPSSPVIVSLTSYGYDNDPHLQGPMFTSETTAMLGVVTSLTGNRIY